MWQARDAAEAVAQKASDGGTPSQDAVSFETVFQTELLEIRERHNRNRPQEMAILADITGLSPTTALGLTGITCSGGGIRSAAFCLGVLQGLQSRNVIQNMDYLSTVSGGGYIGTMMTIGMSSDPEANAKSQDGVFPFGRLDDERRETLEVQHLRDNSRYLLQGGWPGIASAVVIYLRGIAMNIVVLLPILLVAAGILISLNPNTKELVTSQFLGFDLTARFGSSKIPFTLVMCCVLSALIIVYAVLVSVRPIAPLRSRQLFAKIAGWIFFAALLVVLFELHAVLLRLVFEAQGHIKLPQQTTAPAGAQVFDVMYQWAKTLVLFVAPLVVAILPFLKNLAATASKGDAGGWGDVVKRLASRVILIVAALLVPLLLWLAMMQLAFWGTAISTCTESQFVGGCKSVTNAWPHAPSALQWLFEKPGEFRWINIPVFYWFAAVILFACWPFFSVNANSLHQLYRDRLGSAFLHTRHSLKRRVGETTEAFEADAFKLTDIDPRQGPYQLINTALNVPGSRFANRRGRNADFFLFSRCYVGSDATDYVRTEWAEKAVDGLNIGTAMAISGAAAAPNMGMASIRPLSPTIALLNVRLGRWVRHPRDIAKRWARLEKWRLLRIPGPYHLLLEAFAKSGAGVTARDANAKGDVKAMDGVKAKDDVKAKDSGFVFLTDGGHIDNLGIYELLRRRCRIIIAIDAEADPDLTALSLVQVERFARIDLNVIIQMAWPRIAARTRAVADEMRAGNLKSEKGPHVAVGTISYPPSSDSGGQRESGVIIYIKASVTGDENDYVLAYKAANQRFPHETTADQLFSEQQFEAYRALGEHIGRRFVDGRDEVAVFADDRDALLKTIKEHMPATDVR